jgi:hypothetical protein
MADDQATNLSPSDPASDGAGGVGEGGTETATLNRPWLVKMAIFIVVLIGFGLWGLYDAALAYPARGNAHAEYAEWQYLKAVKLANGGLSGVGEGMADPSARMSELNAKTRNDVEQAEYDWLLALSRMHRLNAGATKVENPNQRLDELTKKWTGTQQPLPLEAYDLPFQWSIVVVGFGLAAVVAVNVAKSAAKKYTWEPATSTLTLPGGRRVTADDLADVDKTKWHKYFCSLVFTDGSAPAELDVLKYTGLEEWVLTLERIRFPERAAAEAEAALEGDVPTDTEPPADTGAATPDAPPTPTE